MPRGNGRPRRQRLTLEDLSNARAVYGLNDGLLRSLLDVQGSEELPRRGTAPSWAKVLG